MSHTATISRLTARDIQALKSKTPIVCLTAYTAPMAAILDPHIDLFIVGDSLGMVLYGFDSTLPVTLEMMQLHGRAVASHSKRACVVVDMPFGSYQESPEQAFRNAASLMATTSCQAVKLEGGMEMVDTVRFLSERGIPVMAHIGLMPQHVNTLGGYKYQGRSEKAATHLHEQAAAFEEAGAFALLLEGIREEVAATITQQRQIPTIGIGASPQCDGQVLVTEDMLGLHTRTPKFVEPYASLRKTIEQAVTEYAHAVKKREFPTLSHCFGVNQF